MSTTQFRSSATPEAATQHAQGLEQQLEELQEEKLNAKTITPWLPSALVAIVMLVLVVTSFVVFHCRYIKKRRRAEVRALEFEDYLHPTVDVSECDTARSFRLNSGSIREDGFGGSFRFHTASFRSISHELCESSVHDPDRTSLHLTSAEEEMFRMRSDSKDGGPTASVASTLSAAASTTAVSAAISTTAVTTSTAVTNSADAPPSSAASLSAVPIAASTKLFGESTTKSVPAPFDPNNQILNINTLKAPFSITTNGGVDFDCSLADSKTQVPLCLMCLVRQAKHRPVSICGNCYSDSVCNTGRETKDLVLETNDSTALSDTPHNHNKGETRGEITVGIKQQNEQNTEIVPPFRMETQGQSPDDMKPVNGQNNTIRTSFQNVQFSDPDIEIQTECVSEASDEYGKPHSAGKAFSVLAESKHEISFPPEAGILSDFGGLRNDAFVNTETCSTWF